MAEDELPEPDRRDGLPHPRHTRRLYGQEGAARTFLEAWQAERLHHAWLLTGAEGVGKATLAWQLARQLLAHDSPPAELAPLPPEHPVARRIAALSEPRLFLLRRPWDSERKRLRAEIPVDEVRRLRDFLALSATDGGRRVVIIDAADELNRNAANALLKLLEEPPKGTVMFLVSHQPARLLPTIRSRCRTLPLRPLPAGALAQALQEAGVTIPDGAADAVAALSGGSVGAAGSLIAGGGLDLYRDLVALLSGWPQLDRGRLSALCASVAGMQGGERFDLLLALLLTLMHRAALTGAGRPPAAEAAPDEAAVLARLAPDPATGRAWAALAARSAARARHGRSVNLDPALLLLDILLESETIAATSPA